MSLVVGVFVARGPPSFVTNSVDRKEVVTFACALVSSSGSVMFATFETFAVVLDSAVVLVLFRTSIAVKCGFCVRVAFEAT